MSEKANTLNNELSSNEIPLVQVGYQILPYGLLWTSYMTKLAADLAITTNLEETKAIIQTIILTYLKSCPPHLLEDEILSVICPHLKSIIFHNIKEIEQMQNQAKFLITLDPHTSFYIMKLHVDVNWVFSMWDNILIGIKSLVSQGNGLICSFESHTSLTDVLEIVERLFHHYVTMGLNESNNIYDITYKIIDTFYDVLSESAVTFKHPNNFASMEKIIVDIVKVRFFIREKSTLLYKSWIAFCKLANDKKLKPWKTVRWNNLIRGYLKAMGDDINHLYKDILTYDAMTFINRAKYISNLVLQFNSIHKNYYIDIPPEEINPSTDDVNFVISMVDFCIQFVGHYVLCENRTHIDSLYAAERDRLFSNIRKIDGGFIRNFVGRLYYNSGVFSTIFISKHEEIMKSNDFSLKIGYHYCLLDYISIDKKIKLEMALKNLDYLQEEILLKETQKPGYRTTVAGKASASMYEHTLECLDMILRSKKAFLNCETTLLKYLLSEKFWPSLICYDLLQFCYRRSTQKMLFIHIYVLMTIYDYFQNRHRDSLALTLISKLLIRIYECQLPIIQRKLMLESLEPCSITTIWSSRFPSLPCHGLASVYINLKPFECLHSLPKVIDDLFNEPTRENWKRVFTLVISIHIRANCLCEPIKIMFLRLWYTLRDILDKVCDAYLKGVVADMLTIIQNWAMESSEFRSFPEAQLTIQLTKEHLDEIYRSTSSTKFDEENNDDDDDDDQSGDRSFATNYLKILAKHYRNFSLKHHCEKKENSEA